MRRNLLNLLVVSPLLILAASLRAWAADAEAPFSERYSPQIIEAFGQDKMPYPHPWTIFLHAEDPDGDMATIVVWVRVSGGQLEFATVPLKRVFGRSVKGYIWLPLSPGRGHDNNTISVRFYIRDRAGYRSEEKELKLYLGERLREEEVLRVRQYEKEFDVSLGPINVPIILLEDDDEGAGDGRG